MTAADLMHGGSLESTGEGCLGRTVSERILSAHAGVDARAGDIVVCQADLILGTDGSTPMAIQYFEAMGGKAVPDPERVLLARDH